MTKIEWADESWNPIVGCSVISAGCTNCYAMRQAWRFNGEGLAYEGLTQKVNGNPVWNGKVALREHLLEKPLGWKKPRRIFVNSMGDLFHENVVRRWVDRVFDVIRRCPQHRFLILTKRPDLMRRYFMGKRVPDNVWLGVSVEGQRQVDERLPELCAIPDVKRFVSAEPLLGYVRLERSLPQIDWVIAGGESGPDARPVHSWWVKALRDDCARQGVPFFFKQWGEWRRLGLIERVCSKDRTDLIAFHPDRTIRTWKYGDRVPAGDDVIERVGKARAGALLEGKICQQFPEGLQ